MEEENVTDEGLEVQGKEDTKHEPHVHARPRLIIGFGAVLVLLIIGIVWSLWGDSIQEKCFGDGEICEVELPIQAPFEQTQVNEMFTDSEKSS